MNLLRLARGESAVLRQDLLVAVAISAIANVGVLVLVNAAASRPEARVRLLLLFLCAVALYALGLRAGAARAQRLFGSIVHSLRLRMVRKVQEAGLLETERMGRGAIFDAVARETTTIAETEEIVSSGLHALVLVACCTVYVAILSPAALVVIALLVGVCIAIVMRSRAAAAVLMQRATEREVEYLSAIDDTLAGFKEAKLSARRRGDLLAHLDRISARLSALKLDTADVYNRTFLFTQYSFYLLIGAIVFLAPRFLPLPAAQVTELTLAILFVIAPLTAIVGAIPDISRGEVAAATVARVELELEAAAERIGGADVEAELRGFDSISLERLSFAHVGEGDEFTVGPVDWTLRRGSIVFIVGGNGSGKSTFLQMLTGLYRARGGRIVAGGRTIGAAELPSYRALFSTIFGDFHLFDRLYAASEADLSRAEELLRMMRLETKTALEGDRFTNVDLSTGQRKRLALIVCLLEERPVLVLDELAADQDPEFRAFLYESLLPRLRREGRTIVAVTHDDRWFAAADEVWKMEYGRLSRLDVRAHPV